MEPIPLTPPCGEGVNCPGVYLHGDYAYTIGEDVTDTAILPQDYGIGDNERLVRIPLQLFTDATRAHHG